MLSTPDDNSSTPIWSPPADRRTKVDEFREKMNQKFNLTLETYWDLYDWSTDNYSEFWEEFWHFAPIRCSKQYETVIDKTKRICDIPVWFEGARLNYAENLLQNDSDKVALYSVGEGQSVIQKCTFRELKQRVALYATAMRKMGVKTGDRVVGYVPNTMESVVAMLATSSIGAIWSSTSPDFGVSGVLDRFSQIGPKLIFSVNAVVYNGKVHSHLEKLQQVVSGLPDLERVVIIPFVASASRDIGGIANSCLLEDFLNVDEQPLTFEQLPFNHPLFIMYSSGTTGAPKCMVHSQGGTLIQHLKEHLLQGNMSNEDTILFYTTAGWMMWNWLVSALAVGASVVLYDGSPLLPHESVLWDLIDQLGINILGSSPKWLSVLQERGICPRETHQLTTLHTILSTGSPLKPQNYEYVYTQIKSTVLLGSITGGTDLISCFAGQNWTLPVHCGEVQGPNLGMAIDCWDVTGEPARGESGELVCKKPFPSMPTHFWGDTEGKKYRSAYFEQFEGVWAHGDFCLFNPKTRGIVMLGRSDGTLNPNGVRFGSAEIYNIVERMTEVQDSVCVPQRNADGEERVLLFLKMKDDNPFTPELVKKIQVAIRSELSARHVPAIILETKGIPYTINNKKVEVAVRKMIAGEPVTNRGALNNPEALDLYANLPELMKKW